MIANGTRVLRGPHITLVLEEWLDARRQRHTASAAPAAVAQERRSAA